MFSAFLRMRLSKLSVLILLIVVLLVLLSIFLPSPDAVPYQAARRLLKLLPLGAVRTSRLVSGSLGNAATLLNQTTLLPIVPLDGAFFISQTYRENLEPELSHLPSADDEHHSTAYRITAELAHRYGATTIIELGCGSAHQLARLHQYFSAIGVDTPQRIAEARAQHPELTYVEAEFEIGQECRLNVNPDLLENAVVLTSELLERLQDPFACLMPTLVFLARRALAVVVSSPERRKLSLLHGQDALSGPPVNPSHVREWTLPELAQMFSSVGLQHAAMGYACSHFSTCQGDYSGYYAQQHVLVNTQVAVRWRVTDSPNVTVVALVVVRENVQPEVVNANVLALLGQGLGVVALVVGNALPPTQTRNVHVNHKDVGSAIKDTVSSGEFGHRDWFVVLDGNEFLVNTLSPALSLSLRDAIVSVSEEPYEWNCIGVTSVFLHDASGKRWSSVPFFVHSNGAWDDGTFAAPLRTNVHVDRHKVRVFRRPAVPMEFTQMRTKTGDDVVTEVEFSGMKIYPFYLLGIRVHPTQRDVPIQPLDANLRRTFCNEISFGFMQKSMSGLATDTFIY